VSFVGRDVPRKEDLPLLTGEARFVADVDRPGQLWARVVRSPLAHARLTGIDAGAALSVPGVVALLTADDVPDVRIPIRLPFAETPESRDALQPPIARDVVRYVGEPVALLLAEDPYVAEDAAEQVVLELDDLGPVVELEAGEVVNRVPMRYGDVDALFARADVVVRERFVVNRQTSSPLETRGLVAEYADARLTMWGAAKVKHFNRNALAQILDLPAERIRLVELCVGGGFGARGELYPEDVLVAVAAMRAGRPVKWIEDRYEHFVATNHAREQVHEIEVAAAADGTLLAFRDRAWCDQGAYVRSQGILPTLLPLFHLPGPYTWEGFEIESVGVRTNRTPTGTYRAPGVQEATFVRERMIDLVAREAGLDPVDVRRRNLVPSTPHIFDFGEHAPPLVYEDGDYRRFFDELVRHARLDELRGEGVGIGVAAFVEMAAVGPFETARIRRDGDRFRVEVGVASVGQGVQTALAQIAADALGVHVDDVDVVHHDTDEVPDGFGTFASRSTVLAGNAVALAARDLLEKGGDVGEGTFEKENPSFSFGGGAAAVRVDRETGRVELLRYVAALDVGRAVNPALLRGQLVGAAAQGIAGTLYEELPYDESGQPLAVSFVDFLVPTANEIPPVDVLLLEHPVATNPLGIKGGGEGGVGATAAAIANAVADALGADAARVTALPLTPARVRDLLG
jgi:carbon-monoxide dehydrogenase large subunit